MKTLEYAIVLLAFVGLSLAGCSDKSQSPVEPNSTTISGSSGMSLSKARGIIHSATGSGQTLPDGEGTKIRTFAFTAIQYSDSSIGGEFQVFRHSMPKDEGFLWHGKVIFVCVEEIAGAKMALIIGQETTGMFAGYYDAFLVEDRGEGNKALLPDRITLAYYTIDATELDMIKGMTPSEYVTSNFMADGGGWLDVIHGNVQVR